MNRGTHSPLRGWCILHTMCHSSCAAREEGPLGTRPVMALSLVYRLWVGTRLWQVLWWGETPVH